MRRHVIAAVITLACAAAAPIAATQAAGSARARMARCVNARIGGHRRCLASGQSCAHKYERQYEQHGFACIRNGAHGRYHLINAQQQQG